MQPRDVLTGLPSGPEMGVLEEVVVGYLVTHENGFEALFGKDRTRAENYAVQNRARIEPVFVRRVK
jgi:hypothetical protein